MQNMQTTHKNNATNALNKIRGRPSAAPQKGGRRPPAAAHPFLGPSFVHLLHCFYMLFACFAYFKFYLHFVCIAAGDDEAAAAAVAAAADAVDSLATTFDEKYITV